MHFRCDHQTSCIPWFHLFWKVWWTSWSSSWPSCELVHCMSRFGWMSKLKRIDPLEHLKNVKIGRRRISYRLSNGVWKWIASGRRTVVRRRRCSCTTYIHICKDVMWTASWSQYGHCNKNLHCFRKGPPHLVDLGRASRFSPCIWRWTLIEGFL